MHEKSSVPNYILRKNRRGTNICLSINKDGRVVVTAPPFTPKFLIDGFVRNQEAWIHTQLSKQKQKQKFNSDKIKLFGKAYQLIFTYDKDLSLGVNIKNNQVIYNHTDYLLKPKEANKLTNKEKEKLDQFLKNTASKYVLPRVKTLASTMDLDKKLGKVTLRDQSSRWGSCSSDGNLSFSFRLVYFAPSVIDYVIIHELAHLEHMNHSAKFWALVAKYDGDYKLHRQALKK